MPAECWHIVRSSAAQP